MGGDFTAFDPRALDPRSRGPGILSILLGLGIPGLLGIVRAGDLPSFEAVTIDDKVQIGYGVALGDVDGDGKPDILLADKRQFVWYRNPDWRRFVLAENLTPQDNVCIAAADLDGDRKVEVAVGAAWNPGDTLESGSVHFLLAPPDRTLPWHAIDLPREPTVHRMYWAPRASGEPTLVVAPLHGRGNKGGEGAPVKVLEYQRPAQPGGAWTTRVVDESLHITHNLDVVGWDRDAEAELLLAGREAILLLDRAGDSWARRPIVKQGEQGFRGAGEVRAGRLGGRWIIATVEPFHGNEAVLYTEVAGPEVGTRLWRRHVLDTTLAEGHAVACADLDGDRRDELLVGWRRPDAAGKVGIKVFSAVDPEGAEWSSSLLDDNAMACEDLKVIDLDGDGDLDVVAAGRATLNLKVYWNRGESGEKGKDGKDGKTPQDDQSPRQ